MNLKINIYSSIPLSTKKIFAPLLHIQRIENIKKTKIYLIDYVITKTYFFAGNAISNVYVSPFCCLPWRYDILLLVESVEEELLLSEEKEEEEEVVVVVVSGRK